MNMELVCPVPTVSNDTIQMAHGGGGRAMHRLLEKVFLPAFDNPLLNVGHDGAQCTVGGARLAFATDTFVVHPLLFPGGDIGDLAIDGTVNDLAMCGARALYLSAGFILEEGLSMATLERVVASMRRAAEAAGVQVVTGDTKVVDRGKADGLFVNTAGIGVLHPSLVDGERAIAPTAVRPGDAILLNGDIGRHGMAIMAVREGLAFESEIQSDCAPLVAPVMALLDGGIEVHCLRDLTRGGLASGLCEIAAASGLQIQIEERRIPVNDQVRGACEILGLDPMYVANEGRFVAFVPATQSAHALALLGAGAVQIGVVEDVQQGRVLLKSHIGATRIVDMLNGEQLPRIC